MIKDLLITIDNSAKSEPFLDTAVAFAERLDALAKVRMVSAGPVALAELAPLGALYVPEEILRQEEAVRLEEVRTRLASARCRVEVHGVLDDIAWVAGTLQRSHPIADLIVAGAAGTWDVPWLRYRVVETLLLSAGTPLLLLPVGSQLATIQHAVLGWKPSREAIRAMHDLAAIAAPGARIDIVMADREAKAERRSSLAEVELHLARHGFDVDTHVVPPGDTVAETLKQFALDRGADMLAVGGYAHSRFREVVLGGVTRDLIGGARLPVLLSH